MIQFQIVLLLYLAVGICVHKFNIIGEQGRDSISSLVVNVFLPFTILNGFLSDVSIEVVRSSFETVLAAVGAQAISYVIAKVLYIRQPLRRKCMLEYATATSNYSFLGMPIAQAAYGNDGYFLAAVSQIVYRIFLWGVLTPAVIRAEHPEVKRKWYFVLKNPCMIALVLGIISLFLPVSVPETVLKVVKGLSACSTPMSMIIVGYIIVDIDWRNTPKGLLLVYCMFRLALLPALIFALFRCLPVSTLTRNITVLIAAMPAPSTSAIFAQRYKQDSNLTAQFVSISTILSFITVPIMVRLLSIL